MRADAFLGCGELGGCSPEELLSVPSPYAAFMRATGRCPKCQSAVIRAYASLRAGGGPLSVGDVFADAFTVVSQFSAYVYEECGYTEFYRKRG